MKNFEHPFQVIESIKPSGNPFLLVASGPYLVCVNLSVGEVDLLGGTIASQWPQGELKRTIDPSESHNDGSSDEPPNKKRKTTKTEELPNITSITVTADQNYAVIVTGEDKCVRVFAVSEKGILKQLSQRNMARRPSAMAFIDDRTIACADKFGDLYSLPLLPTAEEDEAARQAALAATKVYRPAASETTVHSKANLKILEAQKKHAKENTVTKLKDQLAFAHNLELGHVAMLTDLVVAEGSLQTQGGKARSYLITADRDEHIRVSRGPPQSYVIEGFCLGHTQFISKLCLVTPDVLVSGGGDDELFVWDWRKHQLVSKIQLKSAVARATGKKEADVQVTVSGLWLRKMESRIEDRLLVACEGLATLFHCPVRSLREDAVIFDATEMDGNILDVTFLDNDLTIVSLDTVHKAGSMTERENHMLTRPRLQVFNRANFGLEQPESGKEHWLDLTPILRDVNSLSRPEWDEKTLQSLLYSTHHLRKRKNEGDAGDEE